MSYINKRNKLFSTNSKTTIVPIRSEARMKNYYSTTDARAWCDIIEERRKHILEYTAKNKEGFCLDKFIPLETIFNAIMSGRNAEVKQQREKIECLKKCMDIYSKIELTQEQQRKLDKLRSETEKVYGNLDCLPEVKRNSVIESHTRRGIEGCLTANPKNEKKTCNISCNNVGLKPKNVNANEILKKCPHEKPCKSMVAFPSSMDEGSMTEPTKCPQNARYTNTDATSIGCKGKLTATTVKFTALQDQPKCCNQAVSCDMTSPEVEEFKNKLNQYRLQIDNMQSQFKKLTTCLIRTENPIRNEYETTADMKRDLEETRLNNKKLQQITNRMIAPADDEKLQNIVSRSRSIVRRISKELGKQYNGWNRTWCQQPNNISAKVCFSCPCKYTDFCEITNSEVNINLEQELEDIQVEKEKLKVLVKEIQKEKCCPDEVLLSLTLNNAKLQEQLEMEIQYRKNLENKLFNAIN